MKRDDLVSAVLELPETADVTVANVGPNDVLVVECDWAMSAAQIQRLRESLDQVWPQRKAVIFDGGLKLRIIREEASPAE